MRTGCIFGLGRCVLWTAVLTWVPPALAGPARRASLSPRDAEAVTRAREGVARRLQDAECRKVFSDFRDLRGRTLASKLAEWAVDPVDFLRVVPFRDGTGEPLCRSGKVMLVSSPDVPRIAVCPGFARLQRDRPESAENLVIHELLHTLGLGENPPTSAEITGRVESRCQ